MSPHLLPRAPSTSTVSPSTATPAPSTTSTTSVNFGGSSTSWDTRVGSPVYSSWGVPASTPAPSKSSGGLLASKPAVAGLCAGIAVVCLLIAGYIYYRVSNRRNAEVKLPVVSTPIPPSSTGRSSKAPTPLNLGIRKGHPFHQDDNASNSSSHSLRQSHISRVPLTESAAQPGQVAEFPLIKYQHTASSVSAYNSLQRLSAKELSEGSNIPIDDYSGFPSRSSERPLSTTESQASNLESSSQAGSQHLLAPTPQSALGIANRRPLPTPPHPPPAYDAATSTVPGPLSPLRALASHARNLAFPDSDPSGSSHSLSSTPQPSTTPTPQPFTSVSTVSITQPQAPRIEYAYTINLATGERSQPKTSDNAQAPSTIPVNGDATVEQPRTSLHMGTPGSPVFSAENDPFSNSRYELPGWLSSDPFPHQTLKRSASQPSLYGGPARSVAASSRVLPSDSSIRTLTPEPTSPRPLSTTLFPPPSIRPVSATPSSIIAPGPVEGQGPAPEDLFIQHGAERQGWTTPLNLTASRSLRRVPDDRFEANESHPTRLSRTFSRTSEIITTPSANVNAADMAMNVNGSGVRRSTFLDIAPTPLSGAMPASANSGRGLARAFSIDSPRRTSARGVLGGGAQLSRGRSFGVGSPSFPDRPSTNFSAGGSTANGGLSGYEDFGWLDVNPGSANNGLVRKPSLAASSNILPSEAGSIRSISPELGYIPTGESEEGHAPVRMDALPKREGPNQAVHPSASVQGLQRASRLSIGEGGVLWGRLTSVMEAQERSPSDKTPQ